MAHPREGEMKPATHFVGFRSDEYTRAPRRKKRNLTDDHPES